MTTEAERRPKSPIAERLGSTMVALRPDLDFSRHVFRGEAHYLVRDPMTFSTHRFSERDYNLITRIDRRLTLDATFTTMVADGLVTEAAEDRFYEFVVSLHRIGFLDLPIPDEKRLYDRHQARTRAQRFQRLMSAFFLQIPLWKPDAFLERTKSVANFFYSRPIFIVWLALQAVAIAIAIENIDELIAPISQVLVASNALVLWTTLVGLKVIHEMGHAWACKRFGGQVPEMGVYLIAMTPCAYVDATASWSFSRKIERIIVCFGGMYFELFVAAIAMIVWAAAESDATRSIAYNVVFLASFATIAFNANPMMKSDGYFALSDILEVPNLRQRATTFAASFGKRVFLGVPMSKDKTPLWMKALFVTFGVILPFYRIGVVTGLSLTVALKFFALGIALASLYVVMEASKLVTRLFKLFFLSAETQTVRIRAATLGTVVFLVLPIFMAAVPLPGRMIASGVVRGEREAVLRSQTSGFLISPPPRVGSQVEESQDLFVLHYPGLDEKLVLARAALEESELRLETAEVQQQDRARREREQVSARRAEVAALEERLRSARISSSIGGLVMDEGAKLRQGDWLPAGAALARIAGGRTEVLMLLTEEEFERLRPEVGDAVRFRAAGRPRDQLDGIISRIARTGSHSAIDMALTQVGGGSIVVDQVLGQTERPMFEIVCRFETPFGEIPRGAKGNLLLQGRPETLGARVVRNVLNLVNRVRHGSL